MLVSKCCSDHVSAVDGEFTYFQCEKCGKPTEIKSSLVLYDDEEPNYEEIYDKEKDIWRLLT